MKKIFIYFATAMMLASCSSEDNVLPEVPVIEEDGLHATLPEVEPLDNITRSTLIYDLAQKKTLFSWESTDDIGVFAIEANSEHRQQQRFVPVSEADTEKDWFESLPDYSSLTIQFKGADDGINVLTENKQYIAGKPYFTDEMDYSSIDVSYLGQKQTAAVKQRYYPGFAGIVLTDAQKAEWQASEKAASAHLGAYDYLASNIVWTNYKGAVTFPLKRLGAICRFYIKCPGQYVYDRLTLVNNDVDFITTGVVDLATKTITPKTTSHSMSVELQNIDMTSPSTNLSYYKTAGYIIVYMMVGAPLDMSPSAKMAPILYLAAHEKDYPEKKHYFKAENLKKPNLTQNTFFQWTIANAIDDTPIEFTSIEVQEWVDAMGYYNGDEGNGTLTW